MKLKLVRWIGLGIGTLSIIPAIGVVIFGGAYFLNGVSNDSGLKLEHIWDIDTISLLGLILYVVSVVIAWFKLKLGGILVTICALPQIFHIEFYRNPPEPQLLIGQLSMLLVGPLLLFYVYYNEWIKK